MSLFGQVWLWSAAAFVVGVLLTWLFLARPAQARSRHLERRLLAAQSAPAAQPTRSFDRDPDPVSAPVARKEPAVEEALGEEHPAPSWLERDSLAGRSYQPGSEIDDDSLFAAEAEDDEPEYRGAADGEYRGAGVLEPEGEYRGTGALEPEAPAEATTLFNAFGRDLGDTGRDAASERGSLFERDEAAEAGSLFEREDQGRGSLFEQEQAERRAFERGSPDEPRSEGVHAAGPESEGAQTEQTSVFEAGQAAERGSLFERDQAPERGSLFDPDHAPEQPKTPDAATPFTPFAAPEPEPEPPAYAFGADEQQPSANDEVATETTQILPKRQPRRSAHAFDPPQPVQPSMRTVERREPTRPEEGGRSGSLFEPAPRAADAPSQSHGAVPPGPFGPGSAMPRPGGGSPAEDFTVKASVTALRYCTTDSPQFARMVAEVWFRSAEDAERVGFRPL
ncbi:hypothetical protein GCM10027445_58580 [Amycolatopsis endophytica]|uniref:Uncharacterized protein n=1 Tax=Amycolatopsis endophytica TaxID=860233 RepID=A0A853AZM4_9PSEU|nr:hypothetical protein [Amycolatopsis endophytica]NYI87946.1 hypothetical protein [Amycolatopsis endophytica]